MMTHSHSCCLSMFICRTVQYLCANVFNQLDALVRMCTCVSVCACACVLEHFVAHRRGPTHHMSSCHSLFSFGVVSANKHVIYFDNSEGFTGRQSGNTLDQYTSTNMCVCVFTIATHRPLKCCSLILKLGAFSKWMKASNSELQTREQKTPTSAAVP